jgi:transcriptional regulator with XRE-family HTH domain
VTNNKHANRQWLHTQLGSYFKNARMNANITQLEIASLLKVTPQYICNYENGAAGFGSDLIRGFIKYYNLSANVVLEDISFIQKKYLESEIKGKTIKKSKKHA